MTAPARPCRLANFYSAMAYPGSPLYDRAVESGWELPDSWGGYSQRSHDCKPLATETLSAAEALGFRDRAFTEYFTNSRYLEMIDERFGEETGRHIRAMTRHTLRRKLLHDDDMGLQERAVG